MAQWVWVDVGVQNCHTLCSTSFVFTSSVTCLSVPTYIIDQPLPSSEQQTACISLTQHCTGRRHCHSASPHRSPLPPLSPLSPLHDAYFLVHSRAVLSCSSLSCMYCCAMECTSGSLGLASVRREQMLSSTLLMVSAGDQLSFRTSRPPCAKQRATRKGGSAGSFQVRQRDERGVRWVWCGVVC